MRAISEIGTSVSEYGSIWRQGLRWTDRQTDRQIHMLQTAELLGAETFSNPPALWFGLALIIVCSNFLLVFSIEAHTHYRLPFLVCHSLGLCLLYFDVLLYGMSILSCPRTRQLSWRDAPPGATQMPYSGHCNRDTVYIKRFNSELPFFFCNCVF
jgi:hypothetical protein